MNDQKLFNKRNEMLARLSELTKDEIKELVDLEMKIIDRGFDIESHEDL